MAKPLGYTVKTIIAESIQLATSIAAVPIAAALKGQSTPLAATLIPIHAIGILCLIYGICLGVISWKTKDKSRGWVWGILLAVSAICFALLLVEAFMLGN